MGPVYVMLPAIITILSAVLYHQVVNGAAPIATTPQVAIPTGVITVTMFREPA